MQDESLLKRIAVDPNVMVGKPVVRGTRIPVALILRMLGQGIAIDEVLREYPRLERADIEAALVYAAHVMEHEDVYPHRHPARADRDRWAGGHAGMHPGPIKAAEGLV